MEKITAFFKKYPFLFPLLLFIGVSYLSFTPTIPADAWFHVLAGKYFLQKGLFSTDIFSYSAYGRQWYPYEWLFQICVYIWTTLFGIDATRIFSALFAGICMMLVYKLLRSSFKLNPLLAAWIIIFYKVFSIGFFITRPQLFGTLFFIANVYLIFLYIYKKKNLLYLSIPITLLWANSHGSIFLDVYLFASYTLIALCLRLLNKKTEAKTWKTLGIYTILTTVATMLPPLGILQYKLLYLFWQYHTRLTNVIGEWHSIVDNYSPIQMAIFLFLVISGLVLVYMISLKRKLFSQSVWFLPLLIFLIAPFAAYRNIIYATFVLSILWGFIFAQINWKELAKKWKIALIVFLTSSCMLFVYVLYLNTIAIPKMYTPVGATTFLKEHPIQGNMFNDFEDGAYILYHLYPQKKVFMDLRFDLYACCEMAPYEILLAHATDKDAVFSNIMYKTLLDRYDISYAIVQTKKGTLSERIGEILQLDPHWNLVYWDDATQIYVRKDGKNTKLLNAFAAKVINPYGEDTFPIKLVDFAKQEVQRMIGIRDSARSRNILGDIDIVKGNYTDAELQFEKAIQLDPWFDVPYTTLGELLLRNGDPAATIQLYENAQKLNPSRVFIYTRLALLYAQYQHDTLKAQHTLENAMQYATDPQDKQDIQKTFNQITQGK